MFQGLQERIQSSIAHAILHIGLTGGMQKPSLGGNRVENRNGGQSIMTKVVGVSNKKGLIGRKKLGRNDPCDCGSGKKYKRCHGA